MTGEDVELSMKELVSEVEALEVTDVILWCQFFSAEENAHKDFFSWTVFFSRFGQEFQISGENSFEALLKKVSQTRGLDKETRELLLSL